MTHHQLPSETKKFAIEYDRVLANQFNSAASKINANSDEIKNLKTTLEKLRSEPNNRQQPKRGGFYDQGDGIRLCGANVPHKRGSENVYQIFFSLSRQVSQ